MSCDGESRSQGISPTSNKKFLKDLQTRRPVQPSLPLRCQEAPEISTALGLVYGALFGFRVLHDPDLYTRFGQVKDRIQKQQEGGFSAFETKHPNSDRKFLQDDLERSLRYWHRDGVVVRFRRMSCTKAQRPGVPWLGVFCAVHLRIGMQMDQGLREQEGRHIRQHR